MKISVFNLIKKNRRARPPTRKNFEFMFLAPKETPRGPPGLLQKAEQKMDNLIGLSNFVQIEKAEMRKHKK